MLSTRLGKLIIMRKGTKEFIRQKKNYFAKAVKQRHIFRLIKLINCNRRDNYYSKISI